MIKIPPPKEMFARAALVAGAITISLLLMEGLSRLVLPLQEGMDILDEDGNEVAIFEKGAPIPGIAYRMRSNEFDARVTHTRLGHRGPMVSDNPDIIFLGDSFTFGQGLSDQETFAHLFCSKAGKNCANLGWPGTGTAAQLDMLERQIANRGWQPKEVKLFMLVMVRYLGAGNDLADNLTEHENLERQKESLRDDRGESVPAQSSSSGMGMIEWIVSRRRVILAASNLARIVIYVAGPTIRSALSPEAGKNDLAEALFITKGLLARFDEMSQRHGFDYRIYTIHPVQDLKKKTYVETENAIRSIAPIPDRVAGTAEYFLSQGNPSDFYFFYDGHWNEKGSRALADFLLSEGRL